MLHPFIHYKHGAGDRFAFDIEFWHHLFIFFSAAFIGVILSYFSLISVQELVRKSFGMIISWVFAVIIILLSSFGIYIGRFVRWNSWDVFLRPHVIIEDMFSMLTNAGELNHILPFTVLMFVFLMVGYGTIYSFTYMRGK
jgi:uncharacterized membrane protein